MLVLTRKVGEEIFIDGNIRVTVIAIGSGKVRLGIAAPPEVTVDRMEIHERREKFRVCATAPEPAAVPASPRKNRLREVLAAHRARKAQGQPREVAVP